MITCAYLFGVCCRSRGLNSNTFLDGSDCFVRLRKNSLPVSVVFLTVLDLPAGFMSATLHVDKSLKMAAKLEDCGKLGKQSRAFPLLEMFCSADENKLLSNQSVNLGSRDSRPYYVAII